MAAIRIDRLNSVDERLNTIRQNAASGVKNIESFATDYVNQLTTTEYERRFINEIEDFKYGIIEELDDLRENVLQMRPSPGGTNYSEKMNKYERFLEYANSGVSSMKRLFAQIFSKLYDALKSILKWIYDHRQEILQCIIAIFAAILPLIFN